MARRFPSFLTVESKLNGSLKINEHLIESYLDIIFLLLGANKRKKEQKLLDIISSLM
jgi:hypothetical protein